MPIPLYQVDAFSGRPFRGNPAAVCLLDGPRDEGWMQNVAMEMNLSETAFVHSEGDGFRLRWFTPTVEVDLCGHATLASAHVLWERGVIPDGAEARFYTRSGLLTAERQADWIELNFPATPERPAAPPEHLADALGATPCYVGQNVFDYLVELESDAVVRGLHPDFGLLAKVSARGIIVTSASESSDYDFISRFFAPAAGVNEDPVTGSAHACLGPFWGERLGKREMRAYQASARGGVLRIKLDGERVRIAGQAVTVFEGQLLDQ